MKLIGILVGVSFLVGCSDPSNPYNLRPGQAWDMQAQNGDITHFETIALHNVGCQSGELLDMHTTKTQARAYWQAGLAGAEVHWILHHDPSGEWRAVTSLINWDPSITPNPRIPHTVNYLALDENAYLIVPARYAKPLIRSGYANWWANYQAQTNSCMQGVGLGPTKFRWTAIFTQKDVDTPVYRGPALAAEQFEGCPEGWETPEQTHCAHEIWYFVEGVGLVEINAIWEHTVIKRIN